MKLHIANRTPHRFLSLVLTMVIAGLISTTAFAAPRAVVNDFFGTGRSDYLSLNFSGEQIRWDVLRNPVTNPAQTRRVFWGISATDIPVIGDYDGDGKQDIGVWRPGTQANPQSYFYIQLSSNPDPNAIYGQPWGLPTDSPCRSDFDGDGKDDFCVTRHENGQLVWYILPSGGGNFRRVVFGLASDYENSTALDFNGDGREDLVVFRFQGSQIVWYVGDAQTGSLILAQQWGSSAAGASPFFPLAGNYIGDNRADLVILYGSCSTAYCGIVGTWWIKETGSTNYTVTKFGNPYNSQANAGEYPDQGDYDGDGKLDIAVFRPENNTFYHLLSSNGQFEAQYWDGNSVTPPSSATNLFENALEPSGKSIPASAFNSLVVDKQPDGTNKIERVSDFYLKR